MPDLGGTWLHSAPSGDIGRTAGLMWATERARLHRQFDARGEIFVASRRLPGLSPLLLTRHAERCAGEEPPGILRDALTHSAATGLAVQRSLPLRDRLGGLRDRSGLGL